MYTALELEDEIWKPLFGYDVSYKISNMGRIVGKKGLKKYYLNPRGYYTVGLQKDGKRITEYVHRLIANAFIYNAESKRCINHKNGIKTDNAIENLEWTTHSENNRHAYRTGLKKAWNKGLIKESV